MHNVNKCSSNRLKCFYTNADMLDNKINELQIAVREHEPDVIAIKEVKPKHFRYSPCSSSYKIEIFNMFQCNIDSDRSRGVALYSNQRLTPCKINAHVHYEESVWVELKLKDKDKFLIGVVYRSDSGKIENTHNLCNLI